MKKEYYSTTEVAAIFNVSRKTIFMWIKNGKIKGEKIGRNFVIPYESIIEKLGKKLGEDKKIEIEKTIERATGEYEETFRKLGKE